MDNVYAVKYDFDSFVTEGNAAPQRKEREEKHSKIKKVEPITKEEIKSQEKAGLRKSLSLLLFVSVIFSFVAMQIYAGAKNYELAREIHKIETQLDIAKSENIRLNAELNGITGIAVIDTYATEVLGMTRVESYQIECVDLSGGDAVLFASGGIVG